MDDKNENKSSTSCLGGEASREREGSEAGPAALKKGAGKPFVHAAILGRPRHFQGKMTFLFAPPPPSPPTPMPAPKPCALSPAHLPICPLPSSPPPLNLSLSQHLLGLRSCLEFLPCQWCVRERASATYFACWLPLGEQGRSLQIGRDIVAHFTSRRDLAPSALSDCSQREKKSAIICRLHGFALARFLFSLPANGSNRIYYACLYHVGHPECTAECFTAVTEPR